MAAEQEQEEEEGTGVHDNDDDDGARKRSRRKKKNDSNDDRRRHDQHDETGRTATAATTDMAATTTAIKSSSGGATVLRYRWAAASTRGSSTTTGGTTTMTATGPTPSSATSSSSALDSPPPKESSTASTASARAPAQPPSQHQQLHWRDLLKRTPWVLVTNGSMNGYFDYVPLNWRVGPWTITAQLYLVAMIGVVLVTPIYLTYSNEGMSINSYLQTLKAVRYDYYVDVQHDATSSASIRRLDPLHAFYYNVAASVWMILSALHLYHTSPLKLKVWATYTVESWTMLASRHVLSALAYLCPRSSYLLVLAELTRFPAMCSATITFTVWNFVVMPFLYMAMKDPDRRKTFLAFCFSPRLINLHLINMALAIGNGLYASPPRLLVAWDFYVAFVPAILYITFYLLVLDRIGVHLYAVFSPRAPSIVVISTWTLLLAFYGVTFVGWKHLMMPFHGLDHR